MSSLEAELNAAMGRKMPTGLHEAQQQFARDGAVMLKLITQRDALLKLLGPAEELCVSISASDTWQEIDRRLVACSDAVSDARAALDQTGESQ